MRILLMKTWATKTRSKNVFRDQWFEMGRPWPLFRLFSVF